MHLIVPLILCYFKDSGSCKLYAICLCPPKFMLKLDLRLRVVSKQVHWSAGTEVSAFTKDHGNRGTPLSSVLPPYEETSRRPLPATNSWHHLVWCDLYNCRLKSSQFEDSCYSSRSERRRCLTQMTFPVVKPKPNKMCTYLFI